MTPVRPVSRRLLAGAGVLALAGCSGLFVSPPPKYIFGLTPPTAFPPDLPQVRAQLLVDLPTAPADLDRRRIALTRPPLRVDYFADSEWADTLSTMVQTLLLDSFENSRKITVGNGSLELRTDFVLGTEVRHFEAEYGAAAGGPPEARIAIEVNLVAMPGRAVVAQSLFERRVPATTNDLPSIIDAFNAAFGTVATDIVEWTLTNAAMAGPRSRL
jgi:cholesterol transport system auxiliary component